MSGEGGLLSASFVGICVSGFSTREQLDEVEAFLEGKNGKGVEVSSIFLLFQVLMEMENWLPRERDGPNR